jgi:hypothetical protein
MFETKIKHAFAMKSSTYTLVAGYALLVQNKPVHKKHVSDSRAGSLTKLVLIASCKNGFMYTISGSEITPS